MPAHGKKILGLQYSSSQTSRCERYENIHYVNRMRKVDAMDENLRSNMCLDSGADNESNQMSSTTENESYPMSSTSVCDRRQVR